MASFFEEQQVAAVLKHGILQRYLPTYARKVGSRAPGGRVAYRDAYASAGAYETGVPGSPVLAEQTAERLAATRQLETFMVERDRATYEELCRDLAGADRSHVLGPYRRDRNASGGLRARASLRISVVGLRLVRILGSTEPPRVHRWLGSMSPASSSWSSLSVSFR